MTKGRPGVLRERVYALLKENPFVGPAELGRRLECDCKYASRLITELIASGFDRLLERQIALEEYFARRPDATTKEAAKAFGTRPSEIKRALDGEENPTRDFELAADREIESRRCVPPEWYVVEMRRRRTFGVSLPEENFQIYLNLFERYRNGVKRESACR